MKCLAPVVLAALAITAAAQAGPRGTFVTLPSPLAQLSPAPPLSGGATASGEGLRHRADSKTIVDVSVDVRGTPFRVRATQRLDVRVKGDYFFTIGAPVLDVEAAPGSTSTPGLRAASILWAGFNPGRRTLIARARLDTAAVAASLPLRVDVAARRVTLVNATALRTASFTADVVSAPLVRYLAQLRGEAARGAPPTSGGAFVTTKPVPTRVRILVPLQVTGTVGSRRVDAVVDGRLTIRGTGPVRLTVTPLDPERLLGAPVAGLSGRRLLDRVARAALTLARVRQYRAFLGNPDPSGKSVTTYKYLTAARPTPPPVAVVHRTPRSWPVTLAVAAGVLLALGAFALAWSRA